MLIALLRLSRQFIPFVNIEITTAALFTFWSRTFQRKLLRSQERTSSQTSIKKVFWFTSQFVSRANWQKGRQNRIRLFRLEVQTLVSPSLRPIPSHPGQSFTLQINQLDRMTHHVAITEACRKRNNKWQSCNTCKYYHFLGSKTARVHAFAFWSGLFARI